MICFPFPQSYQRNLQELIEQTAELLEQNQARQSEICAELDELNRGGGSGCGGSKVAAAAAAEKENLLARRSLAVFNPPYFKDARGFSHPPNADTIKKRQNILEKNFFCLVLLQAPQRS